MNHYDNTYEWVARYATPQKDCLQNLPPDICADWHRDFLENRHVVINDIENIRESNPTLYEVLRRQGIHSLVVFPLHMDTKIIGFYGVDNPPAGIIKHVIKLLELMGHILSAFIRRRTLVRQLREMSFTDQLTHLGNRHAMNKYIENMSHGENVGVVYCDIVGLKRLNDTEGHAAGDRLILRACDCLRKVFEGNCLISRIGGDEFLILCMRISRNELVKRMESLKTVLHEKSVIMSVGASWAPDGVGKMNKLIAEAEEKMYRDKSMYYKTSGIDRRK